MTEHQPPKYKLKTPGANAVKTGRMSQLFVKASEKESSKEYTKNIEMRAAALAMEIAALLPGDRWRWAVIMRDIGMGGFGHTEQENNGGSDEVPDEVIDAYVCKWAAYRTKHGKQSLTGFLIDEPTRKATHERRLTAFKAKWPKEFKALGLGR